MTDPGGPPPALPRGWSGPPPPSGQVGPPLGQPHGGPVGGQPGWGPPQAPPSAPAPPAGPPRDQPDRGAYDLEAGVVDVRPLRFTDILDGSFSLFRAGLRVMVPLVLLLMVPLQLLSAFLQREALSVGMTGVFGDPAAADLLLGDGSLSAALVLTAVSQLLITPVLAGALVLVAGRRYLGQSIGFGEAVRATAGMAGWLVLAYLASAILRLAPFALVVLALAAESPAAVALTTFLAGTAVVVLTPLFVLVVPAIMLEPRRPAAAFLHAVTLVRRAYWRTAGVVLGTTLVFNLLALLLAGIPNVIGFIGGFGFAWVLVGFANILSQLIVAPLTAASMVLLHADLRTRQEGMDFDVLIDRMRTSAATA